MKTQIDKFPLSLICLLTVLFSCRKLAEVETPGHLVLSEVVFSTDAGALSALTGIYSEMAATQNTFVNGLATLYGGLCADELTYYTPGFRDEFSANEITLLNHGILESQFWNQAYRYIYTANSCMEGARKATTLSPAVANTIEGEAKFIRAFCYFYLVNYFGDVPLVTTTDYRANATLARAPLAEVYEQIIRDLKDAKQLLGTAYAGTERTRPNRWTAAALLARVYLYRQNWSEAATEATAVISQPAYTLVSDPNNVFLKNSTEAIWQLQTVNPVLNTFEGSAIVPATASAAPTYLLTPGLYQSFENGDRRKDAWTTTRTYQGNTMYYPFKYKVSGSNKPQTEYYMIIRLAELYLIRAEARAEQGDNDGALADVNVLRARAGLPELTGLTNEQLKTATQTERRLELFAEWSHRWFDLKRTGRATEVLAPLKSSTWQPTDVLWPIPQNQLLLNPSLTQNPGY
jgi:starch-binding outer membrane protein, SusD/RagB family